MTSNFRNKKVKSVYIESLLVFIIATYVSCFNPNIFTFRNNDHLIGYLDEDRHIRALDDTLSGKVPYKDFHWEYGMFYVYIQLIPYILFGKNYNALFVSHHIYLPFISIMISYIWAAVFFKDTFFRLFFVLICIFYKVSCFYPSIRHLMAELSIAVFILSLRKPEKKYFSTLAISGLISGLALLTSYEYGVSSLMTVMITIFLLLFIKDRVQIIKRFVYYLLGLGLIILPYYLYLSFNNVFMKYLNYAILFTKGYTNPARGDFFPMFPMIKLDNCLILLKSLYTFLISENLRFYSILVVYFLSFIYFVVKYIKFKEIRLLQIFTLSFYGLVIYGRVLPGPSYGYLTYGFVPAITLSLLFLQYIYRASIHYYFERKIANSISLWVILLCVFCWVFFTIEYKEILNFPYNINIGKRIAEHKQGKVFYDKVGYYVRPKTYEQYKIINDYIETHTTINDYLYIYPFGPYNHFTKRPSPLAATSANEFITIKNLIDEAIRQLEEKKPRYIIMNKFNGGINIVNKGSKGPGDDSIEWHDEDGPSFYGRGDKLQIYILENYKLEKDFEYAAIMVRRDKKRNFERTFNLVYSRSPKDKSTSYDIFGLKRTEDNNVFKVTDRDAHLEYNLKSPVLASHAEVTFKITNALLRRILSKNLVKIYLYYDDAYIDSSYIYDFQNYNTYQNAWVGFYEGRTLHIKSIKILIHTPTPYMLPEAIELNEIKLLLET